MERRDGRTERKKVEKVNKAYILGKPLLIIFIVIAFLWLFKDMTGKFTSLKPEKTDSQEPKKQEMYDPQNPGDTANNGRYLMEDIINGKIDEVLQEEQEQKLQEEQSQESESFLSGFTISNIFNKAKENVEQNSETLEKDLSIQYVTGKYDGITKEGNIAVKIDGKTKYFHLIGVDNLSIDQLYDYMKDENDIYIEYDINKKYGDIEQAYLWINTPNNSHKENMINVICLENNFGTYIDPFPNIKYTYYLCKFQ